MVHGNYEVLKINIQFWYKRKFKRVFFYSLKKKKLSLYKKKVFSVNFFLSFSNALVF